METLCIVQCYPMLGMVIQEHLEALVSLKYSMMYL